MCGDICRVALPRDVDVFVCELVDTGLIDEMQAEAVNCLRERGILTTDTRMIPHRYDTLVELGAADLDYYGYRVLMPKHQWPHYTHEQTGWFRVGFRAYTERALVGTADFRGTIETEIERTLTFEAQQTGEINAVRVSGGAHLTSAVRLGATNAFNGNKVIPIPPMSAAAGQLVTARIRYSLGGGLSSLRVSTC